MPSSYSNYYGGIMLSASCGFSSSITFKGLPISVDFFYVLKTDRKSPPSPGWLSYRKLTPITLSLSTGEYLPVKNLIYFLCFSATLTGLFRTENVYSYFFSGCFYSCTDILESSRLMGLSGEIKEGFLITSPGNSAYI